MTSCVDITCLAVRKYKAEGRMEILSKEEELRECTTDVCVDLIKKSIRESRGKSLINDINFENEKPHVFVILGASGDLACRRIYPTLWSMFRSGLLPTETHIIGFARSNLTVDDIRLRCQQHMQVQKREEWRFQEFWVCNSYVQGYYDSSEDFTLLDKKISTHERSTEGNRIFYLALPPPAIKPVTSQISSVCMATKGCTRIIVEKPFGRDLESSCELCRHLSLLFTEDQLYRIDHFLGKEMVQNLMAVRFGNRIFGPTWNKECIASVEINFKEAIGVQQRGGYFDDCGIIRDMMQNHLIQILSLVAMEKPCTVNSIDIRDEKVKVLRYIPPPTMADVVIGQYTGNPDGQEEAKQGYRDDPTVPNDSITPTYAMVVLRINNERWEGVPFILKCGKAMDERMAEVRIQYQDVAGDIFGGHAKRNELVLRVQPGEAVYIKIMNKTPGMSFELEETTLDLTYNTKFKNVKMSEAYERLMLDVFCGSQMNFVCMDMLNEAWRIFTPILHEMESRRIQPIMYRFGAQYLKESDEMCAKNNFKFYGAHDRTNL